MKKILSIISVILLISIMLTMVGCGSETTESKNKTASDSKSENTNSESNSNSQANTPDLATDTDAELSCYLVRAKKDVDGLYGYVDVRTGKFVIEPQFASADESFCGDGWAYVKDEDENKSIINTEGKPLFEYGSLESIREYEKDSIVIERKDGTIHLYHGATYIKELKSDVGNLAEISPTYTYKEYGGRSDSYIPEKFIVLHGETNDDEHLYIWFDYEGNQVYKVDSVGAIAGDETGYYFFGGRDVAFDGDTWYSTKEGSIMTNGNNEFANFGLSSGYNIMASDGVVTFDGKYYNSNGEVFYFFNDFDTYYGFQNGYAKVFEGRKKSESGKFNGYIDVNGDKVFEIPEDDDYDSYTSALKDGYVVFGKDNLYGIKKLTGEVIIEPTYPSLYMRENGKHTEGYCY